MNRLKAWFAAEKEKVLHLGPRAGVEYIWQYYKLWIVGIGFFLCFGTWMLVRILTTPTTVTYYMTLANTRADTGEGSRLWTAFVAYSGYDPRAGQIVLNSDSYFSYAEDQGRGNTYYNVFAGMVDAGILDAVTMGTEDLTALGQSGRLMDLSREECRALYEKYGDRLLYALPFDTEYSTEPVPIGIDVSGSRLVTDYHIYSGDCALGIGSQCTRLEAVERFLDFIFQEDTGHA